MPETSDHTAGILAAVSAAHRALIPDHADLAGILDALSRQPADYGTAADILNRMLRGRDARTMQVRIGEALFSAFIQLKCPPATLDCNGEDGRYLLEMARRLLAFPARLGSMFPENCPHLLPAAMRMLRQDTIPVPEDLQSVRQMLTTFDPLSGGRAFQYAGGKLTPIVLDSIRKADAFYGFISVRRQFKGQFNSFLAGYSSVPLLISSLPGHGKTQLTIAHTLASPDLTLITADEEVLSNELPELLDRLALRSDRKFVVFFDDLDPDKVDFYAFRTHVGGTFSPPSHVMLALASNYEFPPSILSRGVSIQFPTFDDVRCEEMVEDFLAGHGFRHPNRNMISLLATRYTEAFGQKEFTELSPRTLIRFLDRYDRNPQLRRDAVEFARGQVIPRPDDQLFYEFNIRLMRKLYGKEYIENLLKDRLKALEE